MIVTSNCSVHWRTVERGLRLPGMRLRGSESVVRRHSESISRGANSEDLKIRVHGDERLPDLILRIHRPGEKHQDAAFERHDSEHTGEITLRHAVPEECTVHESAGAGGSQAIRND